MRKNGAAILPGGRLKIELKLWNINVLGFEPELNRGETQTIAFGF